MLYKLQSYKNKSKKKVEISNITFYITIAMIIFLISMSFFENYVRYTGFLFKSDAIALVEIFEENYMYEEVFEKEEYKKLKNDLLKSKIFSKHKFEFFINSTTNLVSDKFTGFLFDDYLKRKTKFSNQIAKKDEFEYYIKDENMGYISFKSFRDNGNGDDSTSKKFVDALEQFKESNIEKLIIDLRYNSGGNESELEVIADALLPKGEILKTKHKNKEFITYSSDDHYEFDQIFVFLSKESASCAEVLPLTLIENLGEKVVLIGNSTSGKGVTQSKYTFDNIRSIFYVVDKKWYVYDKTVESLNDYLKGYDYKELDIEKVEDYFEIVNRYEEVSKL